MSLIFAGDTLAFLLKRGGWVGVEEGFASLPISYRTIYIFQKLGLIIRWNAVARY